MKLDPERKKILEASALKMLAEHSRKPDLIEITTLEQKIEMLKDIPEDASQNRISLN